MRIYPLSFAEFASAYAAPQEAWKDFYTYGGLPLIISRKTDELKAEYLISLFNNIYPMRMEQ